MIINGVPIKDTYAEAFDFFGTRVIVTADTLDWAMAAAREAVGMGTSIIGCGGEAGIEGEAKDTPDGRPGVSILIFALDKEKLHDQLFGRVGMCVLTCATTSAFNGLKSDDKVETGEMLRYFGDGYEYSEKQNGVTYWNVPMMDGEFTIEGAYGVADGIGGGNFIIMGKDKKACLNAAEKAVEAARKVPGVLLPFPRGVVRSGSKVGGANYDFLPASTNHRLCPTIRDKVEDTEVPSGVTCVYEIVINGLDMESVKEAMKLGIEAACIPGIAEITAGNYEGKLGNHHIHLHDILK
jgi:formylmethanofuran--tetrahydromethanopterin N-formyltransferase